MPCRSMLTRPAAAMVGIAALLGLAWPAAAHDQEVAVGPGFIFVPAILTVELGDTVEWEWFGGLHNVESGVDGVHDGNFRSGDPTDVIGTTFEVTFDQEFLDEHPMPGNAYPYFSAVEMDLKFGMTGTIIVNVSPCPWDLYDGDGNVGILDLLALLAAWGSNPGGPPDFDGDGSVGVLDLLTLLANWGPCA